MNIIDCKHFVGQFPREKNVIIGDYVLESDFDLFFGPLEDDDVFIVFPDDTKWQDIAVAFGIFGSKSQAKKNGWGGDICQINEDGSINPNGFWDRENVGKLNHRKTVLKFVEELEEFDNS